MHSLQKVQKINAQLSIHTSKYQIIHYPSIQNSQLANASKKIPNIFMKFIKNKFAMSICSPATWQFPQLTLSVWPVILTSCRHHYRQCRLGEFMIIHILQNMCPKSFTHQSGVSCTKTPRQELKQKCELSTLYLVSTRVFLMQLAVPIPHTCQITGNVLWLPPIHTHTHIFLMCLLVLSCSVLSSR